MQNYLCDMPLLCRRSYLENKLKNMCFLYIVYRLLYINVELFGYYLLGGILSARFAFWNRLFFKKMTCFKKNSLHTRPIGNFQDNSRACFLRMTIILIFTLAIEGLFFKSVVVIWFHCGNWECLLPTPAFIMSYIFSVISGNSYLNPNLGGWGHIWLPKLWTGITQ